MCSVVGDAISMAIGQQTASQRAKEQEAVYEYNAQVAAQQAELARKEGEKAVAQERLNFLESTGKNNSILASGNVDLTSGSALDLLVNNRSLAGQRMDDAAYDAELKAWEYENSSAASLQKAQATASAAAADNALYVVQGATKAYSMFS